MPAFLSKFLTTRNRSAGRFAGLSPASLSGTVSIQPPPQSFRGARLQGAQSLRKSFAPSSRAGTSLRGPGVSVQDGIASFADLVRRVGGSSVGGQQRGLGVASSSAERHWALVRSIVLVGYDHDDLPAAFEAVHAATGHRQSTVMDPAKYLRTWKAARLLYIRQRLRGEWFPEVAVEHTSRHASLPRFAAKSLLRAALLLWNVCRNMLLAVGCTQPQSLAARSSCDRPETILTD